MRKQQTKSTDSRRKKNFLKIKVNINNRENFKNREKQGKQKLIFIKTKRTDKPLGRLRIRKKREIFRVRKEDGTSLPNLQK